MGPTDGRCFGCLATAYPRNAVGTSRHNAAQPLPAGRHTTRKRAMTSQESPFFDISRAEWIASNRSAFAVWDAYPVTDGHALVVSRRQISDWWAATPEERTDLLALADDIDTVLMLRPGSCAALGGRLQAISRRTPPTPSHRGSSKRI